MLAIKIEDLWKEYRLGVIGYGTLAHDFQSWWARIRGREDPNARISQTPEMHAEQITGDRLWALQSVDLAIEQGEIIGIIGKNGAGKSTLLKILSRVTAPTRGTIKIRGRIASLLEVGTGFHPELTGRENIFMNGCIHGMSKLEIKAKLDEIIDFSGIENFIDTPVKRYSSGMRVRLGFAVAAHLEPEILLVDEVLAVGDAAFQKRCLGKMRSISGDGRTILFVSHNMAAISTLCTRAVLLKNGSMISDGQPSEIILSYYDNITDMNERDEEHLQDMFCRFVGAALLNARGEQVREVCLNDELKIVMTYDILQRTKDLYVPNFHIFTAGGLCVCCLNAPDITPMEPGRYQAECTIPPFTLNEGAYSVGVAVTSYHETTERYTVNFHEKNLLVFNVKDPKIPDRWNYGYVGTVPGVIRPRLSWNIQRVR